MTFATKFSFRLSLNIAQNFSTIVNYLNSTFSVFHQRFGREAKNFLKEDFFRK
jgi:hypothetical protein